MPHSPDDANDERGFEQGEALVQLNLQVTTPAQFLSQWPANEAVEEHDQKADNRQVGDEIKRRLARDQRVTQPHDGRGDNRNQKRCQKGQQPDSCGEQADNVTPQ